jgi:hypothetical protein
LKILSWLIGGYALFILIVRTGIPKIMLTVIALSIYGLLIKSSGSATVLDDFGRIGGGVYWDYSELSFAMVGLLFCYFYPFTLSQLLFVGVAAVIHVYFVIVLGRNRSDLIAFLVFFISAAIALSRKIAINKRSIAIGLTMFFLLAGALMFHSIDIGEMAALTDDGSIIARVSQLQTRDYTVVSRLDELGHFFDQSDAIDIVVGRGLGATIHNVNDQEEMNYLHIAVFSFLMKFGLFPFILILIELYIRVPLRFALLVTSFGRKGDTRDDSRIAAFPFLIGWLALTLMSAGIDWYYMLSLGMLWAAYHSTARDALYNRPKISGSSRSVALKLDTTASTSFYG